MASPLSLMALRRKMGDNQVSGAQLGWLLIPEHIDRTSSTDAGTFFLMCRWICWRSEGGDRDHLNPEIQQNPANAWARTSKAELVLEPEGTIHLNNPMLQPAQICSADTTSKQEHARPYSDIGNVKG